VRVWLTCDFYNTSASFVTPLRRAVKRRLISGHVAVNVGAIDGSTAPPVV
jgi:hypothetical protein